MGASEKMNSLFGALQSKDWDNAKYHAQKGRVYVMRSVNVPKFYDGKTPSEVFALHMACHFGAPVELVEIIFNLYPEAISQPDSKYKRLPLHLAVMSSASPKVVAMLLKADPKCASRSDKVGRLPIHYSCKDETNGEMNTRYLLKVCPKGAMKADMNGFLPLHVACRCGMSLAIIRMLIRVAPTSVLYRTKKGSTPKVCAKQWGNDPGILGLLEHSEKEAADLPDEVIDSLDTLSIADSVSSFKSNFSGTIYTSNTLGKNFSVTQVSDFDDLTLSSK